MDKKSPATNKYAVPALDKGLDILEYMVSQELPKSQTEIATALARGANEIYRVLVGLEARGYLIRDEVSGKYRASLKIYNLSRRISPIDKMRQCALPHMEDLAFSSGHSCHLSMLYQSQAMVIVHAQSHDPVSINIAEGSLFPTSATASGRVLLANSKPDVQAMILERDQHYQQMKAAQRKLFIQQLALIKQNGTYSAANELTKGVYESAVLVGEPEGLVIASLAITTLNSTATDEHSESSELISKAQATAKQITQQLGC